MSSISQQFPCSITITIPLPTPRLATAALRALSVDAELSPLVKRTFSLVPSQHSTTPPNPSPSAPAPSSTTEPPNIEPPPSSSSSGSTSKNGVEDEASDLTVLRTEYSATTNRMLRVAVNGFMESLGVVLGVMEELDVDVLESATTTTSA